MNLFAAEVIPTAQVSPQRGFEQTARFGCGHEAEVQDYCCPVRRLGMMVCNYMCDVCHSREIGR